MNAQVKKFMHAYHAVTTLHLHVDVDRVWQGCMELCVSPDRGGVRLWAIRSQLVARGNASRCLDWLLGLAAKYSVVVRGRAARFEHDGLSNTVLKAWYARHGFKVRRDGCMKYTPPQKKARRTKNVHTLRRKPSGRQ